jgi:hypothetical protein
MKTLELKISESNLKKLKKILKNNLCEGEKQTVEEWLSEELKNVDSFCESLNMDISDEYGCFR